MIAANFRRYAEAMALQMCLPFGKPRWNGSRPTTRQGRFMRAVRAALVAARPQIVAWVKVATPQWFRDATKARRELAQAVKKAILAMF